MIFQSGRRTWCMRSGSWGITYELTDERGRRAAELEELLTPGEREGMDEAGEELRRCFRMEKDYLARYSEQATGIIPLFLSLREKEKILFKVNVIVPDVEANWRAWVDEKMPLIQPVLNELTEMKKNQ